MADLLKADTQEGNGCPLDMGMLALTLPEPLLRKEWSWFS